MLLNYQGEHVSGDPRINKRDMTWPFSGRVETDRSTK